MVFDLLNGEMRVNEIRIGNYIKSLGWDESSGGQIVSDPDMDEYKQVTIEILNGIVNDNCITKYEPIQLTDEWLVKFGFIEISKGCFEIITWSNNIFRIYDKNGTFYFYPYYGVTIKDVHQLQNLYFALTGEELTLKQ